MKLGIMQPYFFPYIGYWQLINAVDKYVIYDDVNFIKGGWINRNRILVNNESKLINLKMDGASPNKLINEVGVSNDIIFVKKNMKMIENLYKKAPYYKDLYPVIEDIFYYKESNLAKYLEYSLRKICDYLSIKTELIVSSEINKDTKLKGQDKVIEICKLLKANEYINAIGGQELYSVSDFSKEGINLGFLKTGVIKYKQFNNDFVPNLSIIDVMMFNSVEEIKEMLINYELI